MRTTSSVYLASAMALVTALPDSNTVERPNVPAIPLPINPLPELSERMNEVRKADAEIAVGSTWTIPNYCTATTQTCANCFGNIYNTLLSPPIPFDYHTFCSAVVQSTSIVWTTTTAPGTSTATVTSTYKTSVTSTSTDASPGTTTILCPTPSPSMQCGISANGYYDNVINTTYVSDIDCAQACLQMTDCKSFQNVPQNNGKLIYNRCNLYRTPVAGNVDTQGPGLVALFYDRDCGNFVPSACSAAPQITPAPPVTKPKPTNPIAKRDYTLPSFLSAGAQLLFLNPVCSCLITAGPPAYVFTEIQVIQTWVSETVTTRQTVVNPTTVHPRWTTMYRSVS